MAFCASGAPAYMGPTLMYDIDYNDPMAYDSPTYPGFQHWARKQILSTPVHLVSYSATVGSSLELSGLAKWPGGPGCPTRRRFGFVRLKVGWRAVRRDSRHRSAQPRVKVRWTARVPVRASRVVNWPVYVAWTATVSSNTTAVPCGFCSGHTPAYLQAFAGPFTDGNPGGSMPFAGLVSIPRSASDDVEGVRCGWRLQPGGGGPGTSPGVVALLQSGGSLLVDYYDGVGGIAAYSGTMTHPCCQVVNLTYGSFGGSLTAPSTITVGCDVGYAPFGVKVKWQAVVTNTPNEPGHWAVGVRWIGAVAAGTRVPPADWAVGTHWQAAVHGGYRQAEHWAVGVHWQAAKAVGQARSAHSGVGVRWQASVGSAVSRAGSNAVKVTWAGYTPGVPCSSFVGITPANLTLTSPGFGNRDCTDCTNLNAPVVIPQDGIDPSHWTVTFNTTFCGAPATMTILATCNTNGWSLFYLEGTGDLSPSFQIISGTPSLPATLNLVFFSGTRCTVPATVTLTAGP